MSELTLDESLARKATQCGLRHECLRTQEWLCEVLQTLGEHGLIVKPRHCTECQYVITMLHTYCTCPVRIEIYEKSRLWSMAGSTPSASRERIVAMARIAYDLRSKDVAHLLDCSPDDVIELARRNKLRAQKKGRFWRFSIADVEAFKKRWEKDRGA